MFSALKKFGNAGMSFGNQTTITRLWRVTIVKGNAKNILSSDWLKPKLKTTENAKVINDFYKCLDRHFFTDDLSTIT